MATVLRLRSVLQAFKRGTSKSVAQKQSEYIDLALINQSAANLHSQCACQQPILKGSYLNMWKDFNFIMLIYVDRQVQGTGLESGVQSNVKCKSTTSNELA